MYIILLVICTIIVVIGSLYTGARLFKRSETAFDKNIRDWITNNRDPHIINVMKSITRLGNVETLFMIIIPILFILVRDGEFVTASAIIVSAGLSIISSQSLKFLFRRTRPIKERAFSHMGYSFPSGHSTVGVSFYLTLAYIVSTGTGRMVVLLLIGLIIGLAIAFSRIYLGVHWASDVIVGIFLGLTCSAWAIYSYRTGFILEWLFRAF